MPAIAEERLRALLLPFLGDEVGLPAEGWAQLATYLELLLRWNQRTNLTAVRGAEEMVVRHFGESLFAAKVLRPHVREGGTVLDLGSGAGFPGLPVQILWPDLTVTLAESQGKKAAFLREVVRSLGLRTEVWAGRAEDLAQSRVFDGVTTRAVDRMEAMRAVACERVAPGGVLLEMVTSVGGMAGCQEVAIPLRVGSVVRLCWPHGVEVVPRGT